MALCNTSATNDSSGEVLKEGRDWSSLTAALLESILGHLTSLREFFACSRMCRGWRSVAVPDRRTTSSQPPILLLFFHGETPTKTYYDIDLRKPSMFRPPADYVLGYSHGHLIADRNSGGITIFNLFTGALTRSLPHAANFARTDRIYLSSSPSSQGCLAVSLPELSRTGQFQEIRYCDMGSEPLMWNLGLRRQYIEDIIFFQNNLYVLNVLMEFGVLDPHDRPWRLVMLENDRCYPGTGTSRPCPRWILATSGDKLLKFCTATNSLLRWDFERNGCKWVKESDLDGRSLFIGESGYGGSALISEGSGLRQNCIYEAMDYNMLSVYSLQDKRIVEVIKPNPSSCGYDENCMEHPVWILPSLP